MDQQTNGEAFSYAEFMHNFQQNVNRDRQPEQIAATCYACQGEGVNLLGEDCSCCQGNGMVVVTR